MSQRLPLFFHPRHLLPQGRIPMRIKEKNALNAMKLAMQHYSHFAICMWDKEQDKENTALYTIGTQAIIRDFDTNDLNQLQLTLYGEKCVQIEDLYYDDHGLLSGECESLPLWPNVTLNTTQKLLSIRLQQFYHSHPEIGRYQENKDFNNLSWLCLRWLEILPIAIEDKQSLLSQPHCLDSCDFLMSLMTEKH